MAKKQKGTVQSTKTSDKAPIGHAQPVDLYSEFLEKLMDSNILNNDVIEELYKNEFESNGSIIGILDALSEVNVDLETLVLKEIFKEQLGLPIITKEQSKDLTSMTIIDIFHPQSTTYLGDSVVQGILKSGVLPINIKTENKKKYITLITRNPQIPANIKEVLNPLMSKKGAVGNDIIIVDKYMYNTVYQSLTNFDYSNEI